MNLHKKADYSNSEKPIAQNKDLHENDLMIDTKPSREVKNLVDNKDYLKKQGEFAELWITYYDDITSYIYKDISQLFKNWNITKFFALLLKNCQDPKLTKKTLDFFYTISIIEGQGLNVNQEDAFKYFTEKDETGKTLAEQYLHKIISKETIKNDTNFHEKLIELFVIPKGESESYSLVNFVKNNTKNNDHSYSIALMTEESAILEESIIYYESGKLNGEQIICNHLDLFTNMCNSRNYSWRGFIESQMEFEALLNSIDNDSLTNSKKFILHILYIF